MDKRHRAAREREGGKEREGHHARRLVAFKHASRQLCQSASGVPGVCGLHIVKGTETVTRCRARLSCSPELPAVNRRRRKTQERNGKSTYSRRTEASQRRRGERCADRGPEAPCIFICRRAGDFFAAERQVLPDSSGELKSPLPRLCKLAASPQVTWRKSLSVSCPERRGIAKPTFRVSEAHALDKSPHGM